MSTPARRPHILVDPACRETIADIQSVRLANLHDSSCVGRTCLNPAHEPDDGADVRAIDVEPIAATPAINRGHSRDSDCAPFLDELTAVCRACGVLHGPPCSTCGATAFHDLDCPQINDETPLDRDLREIDEAVAAFKTAVRDCRTGGATRDEVKRYAIALQTLALELADVAPYAENC